MNYLNRFKQISDEAAEALQGLVSDMINKNTTNILEVGTYAGQATLRLAAAASNSPSVRVISIDENHDSFSPTAEESLKASNLFNTSVEFGELDRRFEENIVKANIIYIDRFHNKIDEKMELIKKNVIVPTKVIFRNPKNSGDFPFEVTEVAPEVKPRARKKAPTTETKETKKETT
tara:strand:- start:1716 stop:2243 length:528 start_codon:yes stop_codon:yes gene_type:complete